MNDIDVSVQEALAALQKIFCRLQLSASEKAFVNDSGKRLAKYSLGLLTSLPEVQAQQLRPIVMAVAIASIIGPPEPGDFGSDILSIKGI